MINEVTLGHVQRELTVGRALLENFEIVYHFANSKRTIGGMAVDTERRASRTVEGGRRPRLYKGLLTGEAS